MAGFEYKRTDDETIGRCFLRHPRTELGWVQKVENGWQFRRDVNHPWTFSGTAKHEAGSALLALHGSEER